MSDLIEHSDYLSAFITGCLPGSNGKAITQKEYYIDF